LESLRPPNRRSKVTKWYFVQHARYAGHSRLRHQGEVALFATYVQPLTINLLLIRFQDHAQGIAHYLQTPRIGYYSIDLTGVPQGVQVVQVCRPLDIVSYGAEGSSVLLLGNAQLLRYGPENIGLGGDGWFYLCFLLLRGWWLRQDCFGDCFGDGRRCRSFLSLNFRRWIRLVVPPLFGNPMEVFGLVGRLN